jgi:hypothetical protein
MTTTSLPIHDLHNLPKNAVRVTFKHEMDGPAAGPIFIETTDHVLGVVGENGKRAWQTLDTAKDIATQYGVRLERV